MAEKRPALASRLPGKEKDGEAPKLTVPPLDMSLTKEVLGDMTFFTWEESLLGSLDTAVEWEKGAKHA